MSSHFREENLALVWPYCILDKSESYLDTQRNSHELIRLLTMVLAAIHEYESGITDRMIQYDVDLSRASGNHAL
jgi:hypothetical protein